jgi:hypothetical protein
MASTELRGSTSEYMDAGVLIHLVFCSDVDGRLSILASCKRARWEARVGRRKASTPESAGSQLTTRKAILFPAWLAGLMFTVVTMMYTQRAQGDRHIWDVTPETRQYAVLCMWLGQFSFLICGGCTKVSILFFYRRLVEGTYSKRWTWLVWVAISFTIAYTIAFCIMLLVNCSPTEAYWRAFDISYALTKSYTCLDTSAINAITGVCAAVSDVYAVALPCIITWHYAIPRRQKVALNVIFSLGFIVVIASCIRTYWLISKLNPV